MVDPSSILSEISISDFKKGDQFLVRTKEGKGRAKLRGEIVDEKGERINGFPYFRLWAGTGTKLSVSNFPNVVAVELKLVNKTESRYSRAKIFSTHPNKQKVFYKWIRMLGLRKGLIEYDDPLSNVPDEVDLKPETKTEQKDASTRIADEDEWTDRQSDFMSNID